MRTRRWACVVVDGYTAYRRVFATKGAGYTVAGAAAAAVALASGGCGPVTGRLIDRYGQAPVLVVLVAAFTVSLSGLVVAVRLDAPGWSLIHWRWRPER